MSDLNTELKELRRLKLAYKEADDAKKDAEKAMKLQEAKCYDIMLDEDQSMAKVSGISYVRVSTPYGSVQDESEFVAWANENEPDLLVAKPRKDLLNQTVKACLDDGRPLPPGLGVYSKDYISIRGGSK
jgi:hypothetical protein